MAFDDDDVIDHAVVRIGPDLTGFRLRTASEIKKALTGLKPTVKVELEYDNDAAVRHLVGLRARMMRQNQQQIRNFNERIQRDELRTIAADEARKYSITRSFAERVERDRIRAIAEQDRMAQKAAAAAERAYKQATGAAEREAGKQQAAFSKAFKDIGNGPKIIDWGGEGIRPLNLLYAAAAALSPALIAVASSAVQASTSVAALGAAGIGATLGIGGLTIAFQGLGDLLSLRQQVTDQAVTGLGTQLRANNELIDSQHALLRAERELHDARREAARDLVDLKNKVADLQNQQKEDTVSLAEAEQKRNAVYRNYFASALDRARADQDVANARRRQINTRLSRKQAQEDLTDSVKKGVERSDKVTDAKDALRRARERAAEARTSTAAGGAGTAAQRLADKLKKSSPAMRDLYGWIDKNADALTRLKHQLEQAFLPGFTKFLEAVSAKPAGGGKSTLQYFTDQSAELGKIISEHVADFGKWTESPIFREKFGTIQRNNAAALDEMSDAATKLRDPLLRIVTAASPLVLKFSGYLDQFATWLDNVIAKADKSGALAKWFEDAGIQMDHWVGIGKNVLRLLGNIFRISLPSGGSLVERLEKFTGTLADWSSSPEGVRQIGRFFDFFKNLPYGDIGQFIVQVTGLLTAVKVFKFLKGSPVALLFSAFTTLAASHPREMAEAMKVVNSALAGLVTTVANNPEAAASILGILAAAKVGKSIGLDLRLPAVDNLKSALTSKFSVLDKVFNGEKSTGTMTVRAAVVNLYGPTAGLPGGGVEIDPNTGKPKVDPKTGKPVEGKTGMKGAIGGLALMAGATLGTYLVSQIATDGMSEFQKGMLSTLQGAMTGAMIGSMFGPIGAAAGGVLGGVAGAVMADQDAAKLAIENEHRAFTSLTVPRRGVVFKGSDTPNDPKVLQAPQVQQYIQARKESIKQRYEQAKAAGGELLAEKVLNQERQTSVSTLEKLLVKWGYTKDAAHKAAFEIYGSADALVQMNGSAEKAAPLAKAMGDEIALAGIKVGDVNTVLDKFSGKRVATLEVNGQQVVFATLEEAMAYQTALQTGLSLDAARRQNQRYRDADKRGVYGHAADGGLIGGYSPHSRADNIPTMLTAREFVQPVDAVKHYGVGFMEAVRTKKLPRFADGGLVSMPFKVDMSKTKTSFPGLAGAFGPGVISGDADVAATVEAVGRAMGASDKQLIAAVAAGLVESGLRNLNYGDRDSLGVFQQRPSQGWGSAGQIMNVAYASRKFYEKAMRVDRGMYTAGQLAQAVQVSAFPERYDQRVTDAMAILNAVPPYLSGMTGSNLTTTPYTGKIAKGLGRVTNVSAAIYSAILAAHQAFPDTTVTSTYRPGSMTVSGNRSYHSWDPARAADFAPPSMALFNYFRSRYGATAKELIFSPAGEGQIKNGRPHYYTGAVRGDHFDHVHLALANGGLVPRKYDTGGTLPPGYTLAYNGTGRNETVRTAKQEQQLGGPVRLHKADIALLAAHIAGASSPTVHMDGRKVAEITNSYTYLPAGV